MSRAVSLVLCAIGLFALSSCDVDVFGSDTKRIAAGWRLVRSDNPDQFALIAPKEEVGSIVRDVGWRKPFIIARYDSDRPWRVIDTSKHQQRSISEDERLANADYRDIPVHSASEAWDRLQHWKRQW